MTSLALLGGTPAFAQPVPFARPPAPPLDRVVTRLAPSYERGVLTNGPLVRELEERVAERLGVDHVVAVSSCTAGLMLALQALVPAGKVLTPSFTFSAGPHAARWNGRPVEFAECDPESFQLDTADAATRIDGVGAIMATHVFGAPCDARAVEALARRAGVAAVFDAAHAFGARHDGRPIGGFGDVEVFSLSPTKPVTAAEGGLVATGSAELAAAVRLGKDYGNPGDYDTRFAGLNARMSELHAAVARESLAELDEHLETRQALADCYRASLAGVPGIACQRVPPDDSSTWKDFTLSVSERAYGVTRDVLVAALRAEGVDTRCYFDPPVHRQRAYAAERTAQLPVTERVAASVVSLPLYRELDSQIIGRIAGIVASVHEHADELRHVEPAR